MVEGPSDRSLMEAIWSRRKEFIQSYYHLAVIDAGSKDVVPVWCKTLRTMGIPAFGLVDLDFLWQGAGKCLKDDPDLSRFCEQFWSLAQDQGLCEKGKMPKGKKREAFRLICDHLNDEKEKLRQRLKERQIWVLNEGEIETYFGLTESSKGKYTSISQKIRDGNERIPQELQDILKWTVSS